MHPEQAEAVLEVVLSNGWDLKAWHVVVSSDIEDAVVKAVNNLRSNDRVKQKRRELISQAAPTVPSTACAGPQAEEHQQGKDTDTAEEEFFPVLAKRTFIQVPVPSSLWSGPTSGQKTKSTTDANPRMVDNPRQHCSKIR